MRVPILKQGQYLLASIQDALTDEDLAELRQEVVARVGQYRTRGVIIDVTALDVLDSFAARTLRDLAHTITLRGAETVIVGIQPDVAFSMVRLGLSLAGAQTALDLEDGLALLDQHARRGGRGGR